MTPDRWRRIEELYRAALTRGEHDRPAYLAHECAGDQILQKEVESLLTQPASDRGFLDSPAVTVAARMVSDTSVSVLTGRRLGAYQVQARIGAGGMGEVYRARDTKLGRDVAIKILPPAFTSDPERLARFEREARMLAALNHPNIGAIYGLEDADGLPALVLELVEGKTLADRIAHGPIPVNETLTTARQIADALDAAHEKGIIHRDLKPSNIKINPDGIVKVLDFGLAKAASGDAAPADLTQSQTMTAGETREGVILGTAAYMSPEQARGQAVDKRTDIWAFGCVVYEMLTGRIAFAGQTVSDTIAAILEREPDWSRLPASTPANIHRLLQRCLQKNTRRRLRDIGDARMELDDPASGTGRAKSAVALMSRGWSHVLTSAAVVTSLIAVSVVIWNRTVARQAATVSSLGPRFSLVTWDASFSTEPALSPDGTLAVYASDRGGPGQLDLWLQRITGGQPIRLTDDPADDRDPHFSADGGLIAFRSDRSGGGIYVMPTLGGDARLVAKGGRAPRFSPDGSRVAFWTGPWLGGVRRPGKALFLVPSIGGQPTPIANKFVTALNPIWSPDGRSILFFGRKSIDDSASGGFDWWWTPLDAHEPVATGAFRLLAEKGLYGASSYATADALPAVWTSEGVIFSARLGESVNLWRVKIGETSGKVIDGSLERLTHGAGSDLLAAADRTGRIAFQVSNESGVSLTLPLDPNGGKALGPIELHSSESALFQNGRNSLDDAGRFLAYPKGRANESEVWVKHLTTGKERHLVTTPPSQLNPVISHDGTKVAYTVPEGESVAGFVIPVAGGTATKVCDACSLQGWLADNRRILSLTAAPGRPPGRVRIVDVVDKTAHDAIIDPTSGIGRADVSPDSRRLAFSSRGRVWIAPLRSGTPTGESDWLSVLTTAEGSGERACGWSPDGRLLYLLLERDGFRDLYAQQVDTTHGTPVGEPFVVQHLHDPRRRWGSTPFGTAIVSRAFVFNQYEVTGSIWLLDPGPNAGVANGSRAGKTN